VIVGEGKLKGEASALSTTVAPPNVGRQRAPNPIPALIGESHQGRAGRWGRWT